MDIAATMTPDGFITLLALVLATLGFLPRVRQLHLRVTMWRILAVSLPALVLVLYFEFYPVTQLRCPAAFSDGFCAALIMSDKNPFAPRDAAFAVSAIWTIFIGIMFQINAIAPGSLPVFKITIDRLLRGREYATLVDLVDPQLDLIGRTEQRQLLRQRHYDWWARLRAPNRGLLIAGLPFGERTAPPLRWWHPVVAWTREKAGWLGWILPHGRNIEDAANRISKKLLTDPGLRRYLVQHRPAFGARLMVLPGFVASNFTKLFITELAADSESTLYLEIEQSGGADHFNGRRFGEDSPLLAVLLNDASVVDTIEAYTPIAEHFLARLNPDNDIAYVRSLSLRPDRQWTDIGCHRDPGIATITFFDLMVTNAARQDVQSHVWLMYADHFVKALLKVHDESGSDVDRTAEWPTRSSELLYRMVAALTDWIELVCRLPQGNYHRDTEGHTLDRSENRIPRAAIITLGDVIEQILRAANVGDEFKVYIFDVAVRCVRRLPKVGEDKVFRDLLVRVLTGEALLSRRAEYVTAAWEFYCDIDHVVRLDTPDLDAALQAALPFSPPPPP
ncbi:hypothetical protein [Sphingobium sp. TKS]|uniref:hypothetical protein n=1 Tax=Sphingobium sp. TKS TaxID=1315974 RepID=UPI0011A3BD52|nr:hypothetical protein [Sphingobium sp. TKS]